MNANDSTVRCLPPKPRGLRRPSPRSSLLLIFVSLFALTGCGPKRMKSDFIGFEKAYAETSNREVLLNLARLQSHDTTYFFKLGQIASSYRMAATLSGAGNYVIQGTGGGNATGGGTPGLTFENDPSFTFIPVNDETSAQLLLKPVPAASLYNLYLQGWRVDQLFRLLVDRIEVTSPNPGPHGCSVKTFRNVPPAHNKSEIASDNEYLRDAAGYATFLRVSAVVYGLQKHGHLMLRGTTTFVPYDTKSGLAPAPPAQPPARAEGGGGASQAQSDTPKAADVAAAAAKGQSWEFDGKQWLLGQQVFGAKFYLNDPESIEDDIKNDPRLAGLETGESLKVVLGTLAGGFSIEEPSSGGGGDDTCAGIAPGTASAHLVMRSLIGIMAAVAQEEAPFDALVANHTLLPTTAANDKQLTFGQAVPPIERLPALRLKWIPEDKGDPALVTVNYRGTNYLIADSATPLVADNHYWNRDMFRLINQLTAQVTVDISKFPLPGILQLHTN